MPSSPPAREHVIERRAQAALVNVLLFKTDTPLVAVLQSLSVVTRQQMDDQQLESLNEALRPKRG